MLVHMYRYWILSSILLIFASVRCETVWYQHVMCASLIPVWICIWAYWSFEFSLQLTTVFTSVVHSPTGLLFLFISKRLENIFLSINVYLIYFGLKLLTRLAYIFFCHLSFLYVWCFLFQGFNMIVIVLIIEISFLFSDCFFSWHSVLVFWVKSLLKYF